VTLTLLHERSNSEPETVGYRELIVYKFCILVTRVRVVPLVGSEPRHDEQDETNDQVRGHHVHPDLKRERRQEREQARVGFLRSFEEYADAEVHEGFGEVNDLFTHVAYCQRGHG